MTPLTPSTASWEGVLARIFLDMAIGVAFGAAFWTLYHISQGNLSQAIKGNVEDAISTLQGLVYLGALVGAGIGLLHGLAMKFQDPKLK